MARYGDPSAMTESQKTKSTAATDMRTLLTFARPGRFAMEGSPSGIGLRALGQRSIRPVKPANAHSGPCGQPGGQSIWRFASRCTWRWGTLSQASGPLLITIRNPPSSPSFLARSPATRSRWPSTASSAGAASVQARDRLLRDDQQMDGGLGLDVVDHDAALVLELDLRRNLAVDDFLEERLGLMGPGWAARGLPGPPPGHKNKSVRSDPDGERAAVSSRGSPGGRRTRGGGAASPASPGEARRAAGS
jgi:hypothetical protein